jgi:hypothetical protein
VGGTLWAFSLLGPRSLFGSVTRSEHKEIGHSRIKRLYWCTAMDLIGIARGATLRHVSLGVPALLLSR